MRYIIDNDLHIHSKLSPCSSDPLQTPETIFNYAEANGIKTICIADHFWDDAAEGDYGWYGGLNYEYISSVKPLPQSDKVKFLFGCETDIDRFLNLGLSKEKFDLFDFIVIPTTHMHMPANLFEEERTIEGRAAAWIKRFDAVLNMDLPFHKVGIAHLTCGLIASSKEELIQVLSLIPEAEMYRLFKRAAEVKVGIELNSGDMAFANTEKNLSLKPYLIAKECGCKFYLGSDAHHPISFEKIKTIYETAIDALSLNEDDKFIV